jgi:amidase
MNYNKYIQKNLADKYFGTLCNPLQNLNYFDRFLPERLSPMRFGVIKDFFNSSPGGAKIHIDKDRTLVNLKYLLLSSETDYKLLIMNNHLYRFSLFCSTAVICLVMCKSPSNKTSAVITDNGWIEELTIPRLQQGYKDGKYTVTGVVKVYLDRINEIDKNGPKLNSIICINPDALRIAEELDKELAAGKSRGPLHGVPVIIKDNIDTHDSMPNTAGATALRNSRPLKDSFIAKKLREAGAIIIAKSNLSEWANFRASVSSSGWSGVGGQTKNPYVLDRNPCGSSSGSGVAVSANLCMFAIGTETNGSIVCPSNNNGIVGIKPTVGLLSRSGIIPISFSQDTPGPMGRTVTDAAIALGAMTGIDSSDLKTLASGGKYLTDYSKYLIADGVRNKRIGLHRKAMGFSDKVDTLMERVVKWLKTNGAEVIDIDFPEGENYEKASFNVMVYEFKDGLNKYLATQGSNASVRNITELIEFNKSDSVELRYFDQKTLELADKKGDLESPDYKKDLALMHKATREDGIDKIMNDNKLDAIMAPTGSPAWKTDLILGDHFVGGSSSLAAISGYPAITVPMGFIDNLPVGVTFFGRAWNEPLLIQIAYSYEQGTKYRKAPEYIVTD